MPPDHRPLAIAILGPTASGKTALALDWAERLGGESPEQVGARADRVIDRVRAGSGDVALFAHGHVLRVLVARWLGLAVAAGQHFLLDTGTLNVLGYYRQIPALKTWNAPIPG